MTVHIWNRDLTYVSVPKCGCTSAKLYFYELCHGAPFPHSWHGHIHREYRSLAFWRLPHRRIKGHDRIAIVRDPISRVVSGYDDKVLGGKALRKPRVAKLLRAFGLSLEPDFPEFVRRLRAYRLCSPIIFKHFQPLSWFLGRNPGWFSRIFDLSDLSAFQAYVAERTGFAGTVPHANRKSGVHRPVTQVSQPVRERLERMFADDFETYGSFFTGANATNDAIS